MNVQNQIYLKSLIAGLLLFSGFILRAQEADTIRMNRIEERLKKMENSPIKFSGYFQTQWQHGQEEASLKVGSANSDPTKNFNRFGIR